MSVFSNRSSSRKSDDTMDDETDDKDDTKRRSRNLSEKKRRDQFNLLINELSSMVSSNGRKMDKSTVLKSTIAFLKNHNDVTARSRTNEIQEDWKPSFLSNEEFTHLFLEAVDGFIIAFSTTGRILYVSESVTSLLGYIPSSIIGATIYDITHEIDHSDLYAALLRPLSEVLFKGKDYEVSLSVHFKRGGNEESIYELVRLCGFLKHDLESSQSSKVPTVRFPDFPTTEDTDVRLVFVGTGRLETPRLIREVLIMDNIKSEFTSRHSLEWKFLFLDHRAPPIIGYLPFEVLGTSGYDYYHVDDLDKVVDCHEALMQKGEGTSCFYRFLTKGQQWIWLQTRFYITYHQWNSKPEFIVCTHRVVSYFNLIKQDASGNSDMIVDVDTNKLAVENPVWTPKPPASAVVKQQHIGGSDSTSISADSSVSRQSQIASPSMRSVVAGSSSSKGCGDCKVVSSGAESAPTFHPPMYHPPPPPPPNPAVQPPTTQVNQLERKHEELQQLIVKQQAELRRLSEQLLMARYGLLPSIINVTMPYSVPAPSPEVFVSAPIAVPQVILESHQVSGGVPETYPMAPPSTSPAQPGKNNDSERIFETQKNHLCGWKGHDCSRVNDSRGVREREREFAHSRHFRQCCRLVTNATNLLDRPGTSESVDAESADNAALLYLN